MQGSGLSEVNLESRQKDIGTVWRHPLDRHSSTIQKPRKGENSLSLLRARMASRSLRRLSALSS